MSILVAITGYKIKISDKGGMPSLYVNDSTK
jgi:hypothetical protein